MDFNGNLLSHCNVYEMINYESHMLTKREFCRLIKGIGQSRVKTNLCDHADVHVTTTTQVIEYTRAYGFSHQLNSFIPLKDFVTRNKSEIRNKCIRKLKDECFRLLTVRPSLYFASNTDIAAREPEPIVANGRVSVEPCGYICVLVKCYIWITTNIKTSLHSR